MTRFIMVRVRLAGIVVVAVPVACIAAALWSHAHDSWFWLGVAVVAAVPFGAWSAVVLRTHTRAWAAVPAGVVVEGSEAPKPPDGGWGEVPRPEPVSTVEHGDEGVAAVAFAPRGRLLATVGSHGTVRLWDARDPTRPVPVAHTPVRDNQRVGAVRFSPDGRLLAVVGDGAVLWDLVDPAHPQVAATLTLDKRKRRNQFHSVAFDPDGQTMATGHGDAIRIWDLTTPHRPCLACTKRQAKRFLGSSTMFSLVFTADGHYLLADGGNGIAVTELIRSTWVDFPVTPTDTWPVERQTSTNMSSLAPHPNGRFLAGIRRYDVAGDEGPTGAQQGVVVWDVRDVRAPRPVVVLLDRTEIRRRPSAQWPLRLVGHEGHVNDVTFSPDGTLLATAGSDPTVLIWDTNDLPQLRLMAILDTPRPARQVTFSADGQLLATCDGTTATLWNSPTATNE